MEFYLVLCCTKTAEICGLRPGFEKVGDKSAIQKSETCRPILSKSILIHRDRFRWLEVEFIEASEQVFDKLQT